jgi:phosphohistidine phosphatase
MREDGEQSGWQKGSSKMHPTTTRRIHLLRHAKSSWDDPSLADHDRPLAPRGRRATARITRHVRASKLTAHLVLCSSATRAVQTWQGVRAGFAGDTRVEVADDLYEADAVALLRRLEALPDAVGSVLVIGHSPAIEELAIGLAGSGDDRARARMRPKYPTGGLATLEFEGSWPELSWNRATLVEFVVPRDLR